MKRDIMLSILNHEENVVPSWTMAFFNIPTSKRLLGEENTIAEYEPCESYKIGASNSSDRLKNIKFSEKIDNFAIAVGKGANFAFGHGGPGEFMDKTIEKGDDYYISEYETGVKKRVNLNPHFYLNYDHPLESLENVNDVVMPDASVASRYVGIDEDAMFYKDKGYFTYANINGIFSGIHYFFYPYDKLFMDMLLNKEDLKVLIKKLANFNLTAAENLLKKGVDCITFCDDLGDGRSLLFSPELYTELFYPYHKELADLCHSYNAYVHMHSHGNILKVFPLLIEAGIDIINPCDPYEFKDIEYLKSNFGDKITLVGGLDKFVFEWDKNKMREFLTHLINVGRKNGGFILMDSGGIPENISQETFDYYIQISKELRYKKV